MKPDRADVGKRSGRFLGAGLAVAILAVLGIAALRGAAFHSLEPGGDHAFMIDWVQSTVGAERFLPLRLPGESWLAALEADQHSFIHAVLRPIYVAPATLFMVGGMLWFSLGALVTGSSVDSQVLWSILAQSGMLLLLAMLPLAAVRSGAVREGEALAVGGLALLVAAMSSFLNAFSPLGVHNVGLLTLVGATLVVGRYLETVQQGRRDTALLLWAVAAQTVACYSMYANVFLLPVATVLVLIFDFSPGVRHRLIETFRFSALTVLSFVPALALLAVTLIRPHSTNASQSFGGLTNWMFATTHPGLWNYLSHNALTWFTRQSEAFTAVGLAFGLAGLVVLAVRFRQRLPLGIVAAHFIAWTLMSGFGAEWEQYTRTSAYVLPFLSLGMAAFIVAIVRAALTATGPAYRLTARVAVPLVLLGLGLHLTREVPGLLEPRRAPSWGWYYAKQGMWRPLVAASEAIMPKGSVLVPWDQSIAYRFRVLRGKRGRDLRVIQTLRTLERQSRQGTLAAYIKRRRIKIAAGARVFLMAPASIGRERLARAATAGLCRGRLIRCRTVTVSVSGRWRADTIYGGALVLYAVKKNPWR